MALKNIFFISFPKSGRTWIQLLITKYFCTLYDFDLKNDLNQSRAKAKYVELFFTHGKFNGKICKGIGDDPYIDKNKIILTRNIFDVLISYYNYSKFNQITHSGDFFDFIYKNNLSYECGKDESRHGIKAYINYHRIFLQNKNNTHYLKYSILKNNIFSCMCNLICNLDIKLHDNILVEAIDFASFKNMKKMEAENTLEWYGLNGTGRGAKVRKSNNDFSKYYRVEDIEYIDFVMHQNFSEHELELLDYKKVNLQ